LLTDKKRPNTIPVFGPGKWLLGESRALKVGINAGLVALPLRIDDDARFSSLRAKWSIKSVVVIS
ncbi:hypothetical protein ACRYKH_20910, partial [Escherichia coli]